MKLSLLLLTATLVCFLSHASEGRQLGVRVLLNQGKEHETARCNEKQFEIVTKALSKMAQKSVMFDEAPEPVKRGRRQLQINCGYICCGFPLGMCGIYLQSKCKGFPTTSSNQQYCSRRLDDQEDAVTEELSTVILLDSTMPEQRNLRGLQNDYSISEEKRCREIKKEAKIAINSVLDDIDDACADAVLLPARLQCFVSEAL